MKITMTDTQQLKHMLQSVGCSDIVEILSADDLLYYTKANLPFSGFKCIVNTHPRSKPGEHWVCIEVLNSKTLLLFDSLASDQHLTNIYFIPFFRLYQNIEYNKGILQDPFSETCGLHCIYYYHHRCNNNMPMVKIIRHKYGSDLIENECRVLSFISKRYKPEFYSTAYSSCR